MSRTYTFTITEQDLVDLEHAVDEALRRRDDVTTQYERIVPKAFVDDPYLFAMKKIVGRYAALTSRLREMREK